MDYNFNFSTKGLEIWGREDVVKKYGLIPIGTECYECGDAWNCTKKITITKENQKIVTMFWNSLYFLEKERADIATDIAHAEYSDYLFGSVQFM